MEWRTAGLQTGPLRLARSGPDDHEPGFFKRKKELAWHVEIRQDKMRRLAAHGDKFMLAPVFKISAVRTLVIGNSNEYLTCGKRTVTTQTLRSPTWSC